MTITMLQPMFLLAAVLIIGLWIGRACASSASHGLVRSMLVLLLAIGLARPMLVRDNAVPVHVFVLDGSSSVDSQNVPAALSFAREGAETAKNARHVLITINTDLDDDATGEFDEVMTLDANGPGGSSPLDAAMNRAAARIPSDGNGSITLMSDGLSSRVSDGRWLTDVRSRGIPVDVVPLASTTQMRPLDVQWSGELRVGSTARVFAIIAGNAPAVGTATLRDRDGGVLATASFESAGDRTQVPLSFEPAQPGFLDVELVIQDADGQPLIDHAVQRTLPVRDARTLLYIGGRQTGGAQRLSELLGSGFDVQQPPRDDTASFREMIANADVVVLDDAAAPDVPTEIQQQIARAVRDDGIGLVMSGGRSSFGAGGWHDTPIESVLPVELVQKEEKRDPSTTLVIVIDTSGSMSGQRVQLAKEVARLAIRRLMPHDKVGLVEFYGAKRWAAPIQPASNSIEIERAINRLDAGGGTVILPAIEESFYGLQNVDTRYKHVLVLTDGGVESGAFEPLLRRMAAEGINTTTVLVGGGVHSEFLVNLANWGKGRFYSVPDRFNLPEIIFKQPSSAKLPSYREGSHTVRSRGAAGWWGDVQMDDVPNLNGYVETRARTEADVLLTTVLEDHPVIATWRYGLGRVTTFATEPTGDGTASWAQWPEYGQMLTRLLERTASDGRDAFRFSVVPDGPDVLVQAKRRVPGTDGLRPELRRADGDESEIRMTQRSPDTWQARLLSPGIGEHERLVGGSEGSVMTSPTRIVVKSTTVAELETDPANGLDLDVIAAATGGSVRSFDDSATFTTAQRAGVRATNLTPWLLGLALCVFLADVAWRRRPT